MLLPEDPYEEWLVPLRDRLEQRFQAVVLEGVEAARRRGNVDLATRLVRHALTVDPADEAAHRAAIELLLEAGQVHAARRQLLACTEALRTAYGVSPSPDLEARIAAAVAARPANLPGVVSEPDIIGRRHELEALDGPFDAVAAGRLAAVLVRGEAGIGKSRFLREVVRTGVAGSWQVLELHGIEHGGDTPFAALGMAIARAVDQATVEGWGEPARSAAMTIAPSLESGSVLTFSTDEAMRNGVVDVLRRLARARPMVLAADDIQWLDPATIALFDRSISDLRDVPILLAMGLRDEPRPPDAPVDKLARRVARSGGAEVRLGPLGGREI
jgi:hypothetical protein